MIFDSIEHESTNRYFSTQLSRAFHKKVNFDVEIEPWHDEHQPQSRTYTKKQERKKPIEIVNKSRKKSVDERIQEMYRKYSKDGINIGQYVQTFPLNSRQMYRQKLHWLEKGHQFKQIGSTIIPSESETPQVEQKVRQERVQKPSYFYCLDQKNVKSKKLSPPKRTLEYKGIQNFQRMLKIKEKLRKKHTLSVHKQKQSFQEQYNLNMPHSQRQISSEISAKATLQRNKLKLKMRGLSKQKLCQAVEQSSKMEIKGTCTNACEFSTARNCFDLTNYSCWNTQKSTRPNLSSFLSQGSRQLSR